MTNKNHYSCDILIAGAGFAGSLMALVLHSLGLKICLVEKGQHPRFAIGESSTPIADMMLRELAATYNLPWLAAFSRYGSWQQAHPEIVCGLKRGFSYFKHYPGKHFTTNESHANELLVAASTDDVQSDTNWLRADFDAFLANKVKQAGITYVDLTTLVRAETGSAETGPSTKYHSADGKSFETTFFIDASGSGALLDTLFEVKSSSDGFLTDSFAVFSHFNHVPRWMDMLKKSNIPTADFPYDPDNSALHQVIDEGWLWMLRFNDERTSLGFALNAQKTDLKNQSPEEIWDALLKKYPSLNDMLNDLPLSVQPGAILKSPRLQRKIKQCFGPGWVALPHTAGFIDPLFSSGIAHSLTGIKKIADIIQQHLNQAEELHQALTQYEKSIFEELKFIDQLVAGCYDTMDHFELFNAWSMLYFAATIQYEQRKLKRLPPGSFLGADDKEMRAMVDQSYKELKTILKDPTQTATSEFTANIRQRIAPVNIAGLLDPTLKNMYRHTAVSL
jgi:tetracycline 7-halogenase / FADH2 O2-dependent halogenase